MVWKVITGVYSYWEFLVSGYNGSRWEYWLGCMFSTFGCDGRQAILAITLLHCIMIAGGKTLYPYTADLLCLNMCKPSHDHAIPALLSHINTPQVTPAWESALSTHPDKAFAKYILDGLCLGFRVGFQCPSPLKSASANMPSAREHPGIVEQYLADKLAKGWLFGPVMTDLYPVTAC